MNQWLLALSVVLAGCGSPKHFTGDPQGRASITSSGVAGSLAVTTRNSGTFGVDFGPVAVGQERSGAVLLQNTGTAPLQLISIATRSDPEVGDLPLTAGELVQPGAGISLDLSFTPSDAGLRSAAFVIDTDSAVEPTVTLFLIGTGTTQ